jgi:hypothetical protein
MAISPTAILDLKFRLLKMYIDCMGGIEKLPEDVIDEVNKVYITMDGEVNADTVSPLLMQFIDWRFKTHLQQPAFDPAIVGVYLSTLQKSFSFLQQNIDTAESFDVVYDFWKNKAGYLFRGQREAKWRIYSTLQRQWILKSLAGKGYDYRKLLEQMTSNGKASYRDHYFSVLGERHIDAENDITVLGFLQHHGCPTPLLDWTWQFPQAVFFGIDGLDTTECFAEIDQYFSIYLMREEIFAGSGMRRLMYGVLKEGNQRLIDELVESLDMSEQDKLESRRRLEGKAVIDLEGLTGFGTITDMLRINTMLKVPATYFDDGNPDYIRFSLNNSKNIRNQAGVFSWNADPAKPLEMVFEEWNQAANEADREVNFLLCECFNIHKSLEGHIRERLAADGIDKNYIYPFPELSTWHIFEELLHE